MNANTSSQSSPDRPDLSKADRPSSAARLPSLNQLAARISANPPHQTTNALASRPRLAASLLRTGSQTSLSTTTSLADSVAVNYPVTRSTSPAALSTSPPNSTNGSVNGDALPASATAGPGEQLTVEKVEKLAQETAGLDKYPKKAKGFKNIPTLDAITARYARTRTLSVDGTAVPPEAEPIEDPQTPGLMTKPPEHPLQHSWCVPVRLGWEVPPHLPPKLQTTLLFTHVITCHSSLYTQGRYITTQSPSCRTRHRQPRITRTRRRPTPVPTKRA